MLNDASGFKHIYLCTGYTDLRRGIDGLIEVVNAGFKLDPRESGSIFLFCGRIGDRIKALLYLLGFFRFFARKNVKKNKKFLCNLCVSPSVFTGCFNPSG